MCIPWLANQIKIIKITILDIYSPVSGHLSKLGIATKFTRGAHITVFLIVELLR